MVSLHQSIEGGVSWKKLYKRTADAIATYTKASPSAHKYEHHQMA